MSVATVMLESVAEVRTNYGPLLIAVEWFFTILFTIEYIARLVSVGRPSRYAVSFFGVVDLISILPTYLSVVFAGAQSLLIIRVFRLLRIFRVLKLRHYLTEAQVLEDALRGSRLKITVFLAAVLSLSIVAGALMYLVEGPAAGFTSIPRGVYWAIVTMTTVGYGDIAPLTPVGQVGASCLMILGYAIIAVPTGIVSVAIAQQMRGSAVSTQACLQCGREGHAVDAEHCQYCGAHLGDGHYSGRRLKPEPRSPPPELRRVGCRPHCTPPDRCQQHELHHRAKRQRRCRCSTKRYVLQRRIDVGRKRGDQEQHQTDAGSAPPVREKRPETARDLKESYEIDHPHSVWEWVRDHRRVVIA